MQPLYLGRSLQHMWAVTAMAGIDSGNQIGQWPSVKNISDWSHAACYISVIFAECWYFVITVVLENVRGFWNTL